jgi:hypothetical protein
MERGPAAARTVLLGLFALGALVVVLVANVLATDDAKGRPAALPLHPVAGQFQPDSTTLAECSEQTCVEQAFGNIAFRRGPKAAIALFDRRLAEDDRGCHRIAHSIGAASLARNDGNVARTFAQGTSSCWSGYYHGVLERSLLAAQAFTRGSLATIARSLCADTQVRAVTWLAFQCLHGLGHGLMISTGYDLRLALDTCRRLATEGDGEACKGGAFMENLSPMDGGQSRWLRDDDPLYPCGAVVESDKYECYKRVTTRILAVIGFDWERVAEMCASLEPDYVPACFTSFGRDVSAQNGRDPAEITRLCEVARRYGAERRCISAAAMDVVSNYASGEPAAALCDATSPRFRGTCYQAIGSIMGRFRQTAVEREADCRALTPVRESVAWCLRGARRAGDMVAIR